MGDFWQATILFTKNLLVVTRLSVATMESVVAVSADDGIFTNLHVVSSSVFRRHMVIHAIHAIANPMPLRHGCEISTSEASSAENCGREAKAKTKETKECSVRLNWGKNGIQHCALSGYFT